MLSKLPLTSRYWTRRNLFSLTDRRKKKSAEIKFPEINSVDFVAKIAEIYTRRNNLLYGKLNCTKLSFNIIWTNKVSVRHLEFYQLSKHKLTLFIISVSKPKSLVTEFTLTSNFNLFIMRHWWHSYIQTRKGRLISSSNTDQRVFFPA